MRRIFVVLMLFVMVMPSIIVQAAPPVIAGCNMFPEDNPWNTDISTAPVHPNSAAYISNINSNGGKKVHPDFGEDPTYGIPWTTVTGSQPLVPISFYYPDDSDPGPYPIPSNAPVESGGDRHILLVETTNCKLYEVYDADYTGSDITGWEAGSGAIFDLNSNDLRPEGWTSADAAGLPILPGLARCEEANSGTINHALRFTVNRTQKAFIYPATHYASSLTGTNYPPMGLRLRLKANYNISHLDGQALAIAQALKTYGMILADNGSNWYISGETNPTCWNDDDLNRLKNIPGTAFEVIVSPPPPSDVVDDLMKNGSFEAGLVNNKQPAYWTRTVKQDIRRCSQNIDITGVGLVDVAHSGRCAFEFKASNSNDFIRQIVTIGSFSPTATITFKGFVAASNASVGGLVKATLIYANGTKVPVSIPLDGGSYDYAAFGFNVSSLDMVGLTKINLKIVYKGTTGRLWVDSVSLALNDVSRDTLPFPSLGG